MKGIYKILVIIGCLSMAACRKTDYPVVSNPAYLRVFNCLTDQITLDTKDDPGPYLTMLIDPKLDATGVPQNAAVTFDFLGQRVPYARPYPDAGNTAVWQTEFPGAAKIAVGPIVNGFDLSAYGQVTSGTHRIMFMTRPFSNDPFYSLAPAVRSRVLIDTTITLQQGEIYTMNVLEQSVLTGKVIAQVRNEQFTKIPFSDSMVYVNFYNETADGFFAAGGANSTTPLNSALHDTMNIFLSLMNSSGQAISGFTRMYMYNLIRSQDATAHPYSAFPLFPDSSANHIYAGQSGQEFFFIAPGFPPTYGGPGNQGGGTYGELDIGPKSGFSPWRIIGDVNTGMVVTTRSGIYNPRSFATVNTIEYINGNMYLTVLQRRYDPPIY